MSGSSWVTEAVKEMNSLKATGEPIPGYVSGRELGDAFEGISQEFNFDGLVIRILPADESGVGILFGKIIYTVPLNSALLATNTIGQLHERFQNGEDKQAIMTELDELGKKFSGFVPEP